MRNGVYNQKVIIDRPNIVLVGESKDSTILRFAETDKYLQVGEYKGKKIDSSASDFDADSFEGLLANVRITRAKPYSVEGELESFIDESR